MKTISEHEQIGRMTSVIVREFLASGGQIESVIEITGSRPDFTVWLFTVPGREGTFICDNGGVSWTERNITDTHLEMLLPSEDLNAKSVSEI